MYLANDWIFHFESSDYYNYNNLQLWNSKQAYITFTSIGSTNIAKCIDIELIADKLILKLKWHENIILLIYK